MEFNRFLTKPGFMPVMTCDLDDCQNKGGDINEKQAYYQSLGPTVNVSEKVFHVKCLELHSRKKMLDELAEKGRVDAE